MGVSCKSCGHDNRLGASYCGNCAQPLTGGVTCLRCAAQNPSRQNFCNSCGSSLSGGKRTPLALIGRPFATAESPGRRNASTQASVTDEASREQARFAHTRNLTLATIAVAVTGVILAVTRLWDLGFTPADFVPREEAFILVARQIEFEGWIGLSHGLLDGAFTGYAYVLSFWMALVGDELGAARMLSGIASLASVGVMYFLIGTLFNRRVAFFATALMAVGVWPLTYARLALPMSLLLLIEITALYILFRALHTEFDETSRRRLLALSGILVGLSLYFDFVALVFTAATLCLWLRYYVSGKYDLRVLGERFAAFALPALIVSMPFWAVAASDVMLRDDVKDLLITETPRYLESDGVMGELRTVTGNIVNTGRALVWSTSADEFGRGGGRIVDPLTGLLVLVGLLVCLRRWREDSFGALLVLFIVVAVGVGLTQREGMFARLIIAAPIAFAIAGFAADWLLSWAKGRVPGPGIVAIVALLWGGVILFNLTAYYGHPIGEVSAMWIGSVVENVSPQNAIAMNAP